VVGGGGGGGGPADERRFVSLVLFGFCVFTLQFYSISRNLVQTSQIYLQILSETSLW
jgi:hypothetical protein